MIEAILPDDASEHSTREERILNSIRRVTAQNGYHNILSELSELEEKLAARKLYVVVVGLFKRGKSSLVNALLDMPVAPVAVTPLTSIITFFHYGEKPLAEVVFENGTQQDIQIKDIAGFVAEESNPENIKKVKQVNVWVPAELLKDIILIDTPGLGSLQEHNSETTYAFVPKIDAGVFVLSADLPMSKADGTFLQKIASSVPGFMYVLNKTDLLRAAELQTMSDFNIRSIAGLTDADAADIRLYPVSARQYSESVLPEEKQQSGIPAFKDAILALTLNKGHELIRASFRIRLDTLLHKTENLLRLQLAALQTPVEVLERQMSQLESSLHLLSAEQEDFLLFVRGKVNKLKEEIIQTIEHRAKEIFREREQALLADDALLPILKSVASNQYLSTMIAAINQEFEALHRQVERETKERFKHLMFQYIGQSEHFLKEVATQLEKLLGVKPSILPEAFDLEVYTSFYLHAIPEHKVPDTRTNILYRLLPYEYAQKRIVKTVLKNYRDIIISNSAGMMYDMTYRMDESFRKFAADLRRTTTRITDELRNLIRTCIAKKSDTQHQIKETMANVIDNISEIEQLKSQFKAIKTSKDGPDRES